MPWERRRSAPTIPPPPTSPQEPPVSRTIRCAAVALLGLAVLSSCSGGGSSGTGSTSGGAERFTVVLDWTPNTNHAGTYLARAKGWYRARPASTCASSSLAEAGALALLGAGKADVAVSVQEEVVPAVAQGVPVQAIAAIVEHNTSSLVSLASGWIEGPEDLAGTTYGATAASSRPRWSTSSPGAAAPSPARCGRS
ncbi:MAG: ABC transporter substrate-binding protein [Acidimicrobiales bacterium]